MYSATISTIEGSDVPAVTREQAEAVASHFGIKVVEEEEPAGIGLWSVELPQPLEFLLKREGWLDLENKGRIQIEMP